MKAQPSSISPTINTRRVSDMFIVPFALPGFSVIQMTGRGLP
jgi:hypothetical protein